VGGGAVFGGSGRVLGRLRRGGVLGTWGGVVVVGLSRGEALGGRGWGGIELSGCGVAVASGLWWGCKY
jgi:hypothetical protein